MNVKRQWSPRLSERVLRAQFHAKVYAESAKSLHLLQSLTPDVLRGPEHGKYINVWKQDSGRWRIQANIWKRGRSGLDCEVAVRRGGSVPPDSPT